MANQRVFRSWITTVRFFSRPRGVLLVYAALLVLYVAVLHPWLLNWGATEDEVSMALPGDAAIASAATHFTRAVTIDAPVAEVWP